MKLLLIGNGSWAKNYLQFKEVVPSTRETYKQLLKNQSFQGVIIATSADSHISIAEEVMEYNIPMMIEKPLALTSIEITKLKHYPVMVNHIHLFAPAFERLLELVSIDEIAEIKSVGVNNGPIRSTCNSLFDYAPHDFSMSMMLMNKEPKFDYNSYLKIDIEDASNHHIKLKYDEVDHEIYIGNASNHKERSFKVVLNNGNYIVYDDVSKDKLKFNKKSIKIPDISSLENAVNHFKKLIEGHTDPRFGTSMAYKITKILESI